MDSSTYSADLSSQMEALTASNSDDKKKQLRVFAFDCSGSTGGCQNYFTVAGNYLEKFAKEEKLSCETVYLLWDNTCNVSTVDKIRSICSKMKGYGGTDPSKIVSWLISNYPKDQTDVELWLITDGEIGDNELQKCAILNQNVSYSRIRFAVIDAYCSGNGNSQRSLSVGAAFFSGSQVELFWNEKLMKRVDTSKPFDYSKINAHNFNERWDELSDFIKIKFMGSDRQSLEEIERLKKLKARLLREFSDTQESVDEKKFPDFFKITTKEGILEKLRKLEFYEILTNSGKKDFVEHLDAGINTLINYIHNKECRNYGFESLKVEFKFEQTKTVNAETEPELDTLEDAVDCKFYDAVSLEEEGTPVLLLNITDLVKKHWIDGSFSKFRAILDCPLYTKIDGSIGHVYSYETFKSLCDASHEFSLTDPMSREQAYGGLIFCKAADSWNDFVLSKTFFRGKKFRTCLPLWYFLIYKYASQKEWIEPDVIETLKTYVVRRLTEAKVPLALGTLPLDPKEIVPLHVALYYCTEGSSKLFGQDPVLFPQERLRMYHPVAEDMMQIVELIGGIGDGIDVTFVTQRTRVLGLVNKLKQIPEKTEKVMYLLQKAFKANDSGFLTNEVEDSSYLQYFNLLQYSHKVMLPFNVLDNPRKDFRDFVVLPYHFEINKNITISRKTCRPLFVVRDCSGAQVAYYRELKDYVKNAKLNIDGELEIETTPVKKLKQARLVSHCKLYIDLAVHSKKFPTWEEYVDYAKKRYRTLGTDEKIFLHFPNVTDHLQHFFNMYSELNVHLEKFLTNSVKSISTLERLSMEGVFRGPNGQQFVLEERKVVN